MSEGPRLAEMRRRHGDPKGLAVLVRSGWSVTEIASLDPWLTISPVRLTGALGAAADAVEAGVTGPAQAIAWTHAMFVAKGKIAQARDIVDQMGAPGVRVEDGHGVSRAPFIEALQNSDFSLSNNSHDLAGLGSVITLKTLTTPHDRGNPATGHRACRAAASQRPSRTATTLIFVSPQKVRKNSNHAQFRPSRVNASQVPVAQRIRAL